MFQYGFSLRIFSNQSICYYLDSFLQYICLYILYATISTFYLSYCLTDFYLLMFAFFLKLYTCCSVNYLSDNVLFLECPLSFKLVKTSPSFSDAAMGRIAQGTKVLAEGGYEKIFRHTFETVPEEQLQNSFACYLSTSAGPVMGILYISTAKLAFCSDNPLSYKAGEQMEWSYYKVSLHEQCQFQKVEGDEDDGGLIGNFCCCCSLFVFIFIS